MSAKVIRHELLSERGCSRALFLSLVFLVLTTAGWAQTQASAAQDNSRATASQQTDARSTQEDSRAMPSQQSDASAKQQTDGAAAQATPAHGPIHMVPYGPPKTLKARPGESNNGKVQYYGGPVISNVHVVQVMWGSFVDTPSTGGLSQFYTDITSSNYFSLLAEYGTVGLTGFSTGTPGSNQTIGPGVFDGKFAISPSVCPGAANNPTCAIADAQIQTELTNQIAASHLPQPVQDAQGNFNTIYMVYFPPGVIITTQGIESCVAFGFCAYHSNTMSGATPKFPYGVFPDFGPTSGCSTGCGTGTSFQNLTSASSHELGEAVTDTDVGSATAFAPPLGWDDQVTGEEIGDFCENGNDVTVSAGGNTYTVQQLWSNMQNACVSAPAHFQVTAPPNANPGKAVSVTVNAQSSLGNAQLTGYNNTVHFTSSDGAAVLPTDYTFVPGTDSGTHVFSVTFNTTGSQTVTATDTQVTAMTGNATVGISNFPDLAATSSHGGSFTQGQTGATYTLTIANVGNVATSNPVTVTDSLPGPLSATAMTGSGWSCNVGTLTCTRSDALAANASYPPITLTVNVSPSAPTPVVNSVNVSVSGDLNPSNDTFLDSTTIVQLADMTIAKSHVGSFIQGSTGAIYTITVTNSGNGPVSAPVSVVDTLPTGLTATNVSGNSWNCTSLAPPTCTTSLPLAAGANYPPITLTVNVALTTAMPTVTNVATVSGGGEVITNNDTASDVTNVTPPSANLSVTSTHSGNFSQGGTGVYTLTVTNLGPAATNSTVTVTDNFPSVFTAVSATGSGWSCIQVVAVPEVCTTGTVLNPGDSYPPITFTVNVSPTAPTPAINMVTVSGGGDPNTGSGSDTTTINQLPDITVNETNFSILVAGAMGATNTYVVSNVGLSPTVGTVIFTDIVSSSATPTNLAGTGWNCTLSNLTCTRSDVLGAGGAYPAIILTMNYAPNATTVTEIVNASGGGEVNLANDGFNLTEFLDPAVSVFTNTTTASVAAGTPAIITFQVGNLLAPEPVTFTCAGVPPGASCNFSPSTDTQGGALITLTINTTGASASAPPPPFRRDGPMPVYAVLLPLLGIAATALGKRKRTRTRLAVSLGFAILLALAGCGGGSHGPPPVVTPPGIYTIMVTVTNSAASSQVTFPVTLTVH